MKLMYLQSGGPTAVINASFYGVIKAFQENDKFEKLYAGKYGLEGLLNFDYYEIKKNKDYSKIANNSGAVLGSARIKLSDFFDDEKYKLIEKNVLALDLDYILINGGNDSMDTAYKLNKFFIERGLKTRTIGIPKTIDNDLMGIDRCPGYGSAVKYIVETIEDISLDLDSYKKGRFTIIEVMGRDAGWLALSAALCKKDLGPDLIYTSEIPFDYEVFLKDVERIYKKKKRVLVIVSEALKDANGVIIFSEKGALDAFGHRQLGSISKELCEVVSNTLHISTRAIEFNLMQRASTIHQAKSDRKEAIDVGYNAMQLALKNINGVMVSIIRDGDSYKIGTEPLENVMNFVRHVPRDYMNEKGNFPTSKALEYLSFIKKDIKHRKQYRKLLEK